MRVSEVALRINILVVWAVLLYSVDVLIVMLVLCSMPWLCYTCVLACSVTENVPKDHLLVHALMAVTLFVVNLARFVKKAGYIRASRNVSVALVCLRWVEAFSFAAVYVVVYVTETLEWRFQFYQLSGCCREPADNAPRMAFAKQVTSRGCCFGADSSPCEEEWSSSHSLEACPPTS